MDELLFLLLKKGAHKQDVHLTTIQAGLEAGMSQQNASRRLRGLETSGRIERNGERIRLTQKAQSELAEVYAFLKKAFENGEIEIKGTILSGLGEGKYYLSLEGYCRQIVEKLGFEPYPGTLNIKIDEKEQWKRQLIVQLDPIIISGFKDGERTYGDLFAYRCKVCTGDGKLEADCAIVVPLRTHHPQNIIEIIAPYNLKERLGKKDGDRLEVIL